MNGETTRFTMDLAAGLTQALSDGTNTYLYGAGRIAQHSTAGAEYFVGDALGSVRQLADAAGAVSLARGYQPYGSVLQSSGAAATDYGFTGEWSTPVSQGNLVYLQARWYAAGQGRFLTQDPFRGFPMRPGSLHRYAYTENNPVNFTDPHGLFIGSPPPTAPIPGHVMNLVRSVSGSCGLSGRFTNVMGGIAQYFDDITLGGWSAVAGDLDFVNDYGFQQGRAAGRAVSTAQGMIEAAVGGYMAASALVAMGPTAGAGGACALATGGTCLILAGGALTAEGAMVIGGAAVAGHGGMSLAYIKAHELHHISTNKNWIRGPQWSKRFKELFDKGGMDLDDSVNKLSLPGHKGPHSQGYHQWVYDRLSGAINGLQQKAEIRAALEAELNAIANELKANPSLINMGR